MGLGHHEVNGGDEDGNPTQYGRLLGVVQLQVGESELESEFDVKIGLQLQATQMLVNARLNERT